LYVPYSGWGGGKGGGEKTNPPPPKLVSKLTRGLVEDLNSGALKDFKHH